MRLPLCILALLACTAAPLQAQWRTPALTAAEPSALPEVRLDARAESPGAVRLAAGGVAGGVAAALAGVWLAEDCRKDPECDAGGMERLVTATSATYLVPLGVRLAGGRRGSLLPSLGYSAALALVSYPLLLLNDSDLVYAVIPAQIAVSVAVAR
jgi:hypothetical protein